MGEPVVICLGHDQWVCSIKDDDRMDGPWKPDWRLPPVAACADSPESGLVVALGAGSGHVLIRDLATGQPIAGPWRDGAAPVRSIAAGKCLGLGLAVLACQGGDLHVRSMRGGAELELPSGDGDVKAVANIAKHGATALRHTASGFKLQRLWDGSALGAVRSSRSSDLAPRAFATGQLAGVGEVVIACFDEISDDMSHVSLWRMKDGSPVGGPWTMSGGMVTSISSLRRSEGGSIGAAGSTSGQISAYQLPSGDLLGPTQSLPVHQGAVKKIQLAELPEIGLVLLSCGEDGRVHLTRLPDGEPVTGPWTHDGPEWCAASVGELPSVGSIVAAVTADAVLTVWAVPSGRRVGTSMNLSTRVNDVAICDGAVILATGRGLVARRFR